MLYRWDATRSNLASLALQLIRSDWYGLLYAGEIAWGDFDRLMSFLKAQPADVDQIEIAVGRNHFESRLFRAKPQSAGFGRVVKFGEIEIIEAPVGQQQAAIR